MNNTQLGQLIEPGTGERDAIHIAIAPVIAAEKLKPGQHVGLNAQGEASLKLGLYMTAELIGVVDPYLKEPVNKGDQFYLLLYPNTITSLRHQWFHPAFKEEKKKVIGDSTAERWIRSYADQLGIEYEELLEAANLFLDHGDYLNHGPRFVDEYLPDVFWDHYEVVTGRFVALKDRGSFFSCSC